MGDCSRQLAEHRLPHEMRDLPALQFGVTFGSLECSDVGKNPAEAGRTISVPVAQMRPRRKPTNFSICSENAKLEIDRLPVPHGAPNVSGETVTIFRVNVLEQYFQRGPYAGCKAEQGSAMIACPKRPIGRLDLPKTSACRRGRKCHPLFALL